MTDPAGAANRLWYPRVRWVDEVPTPEMVAASDVPVVFVPGLAFAAHRRRLASRAAIRAAGTVLRRPSVLRRPPRRAVLRAALWRRSAALLGTTEILDEDGDRSWLSPYGAVHRAQRPQPRRSIEDARASCVAVIISQDRAQQLVVAIESILGIVCGHVLVIDGGSKDGSIAAARAAGAEVVERRFEHDFADQRNAGLRIASGRYRPRWILRIDSDEIVSEELAQLLVEFLRHDTSCDALYAPVVTYAGASLWDSVTPVPILHRPRCRYVGRVHERLTTKRPVILPMHAPPLLNAKTAEQVEVSRDLYRLIGDGDAAGRPARPFRRQR